MSNLTTQRIDFKDNNAVLVYRGVPRFLVVEFYSNQPDTKFYLAPPDRLNIAAGLPFTHGGVFGLGYADMYLLRGDYVELWARTTTTFKSTSKVYCVVMFLE